MAAAPGAVRIAKLSEVADYRACQEVQRRAWGLQEDSYIVPVATLAAVNKYGGLVLGAWRNEQLVGFAFGFLGRLQGDLILYSQLTAVLPQEQGEGLGYALKAGQREWARAEGLATSAWAFDPMQAGNANFNLHRLGAHCRIYTPDMYGERRDALNAQLSSTDRLIAEWKVTSPTSAASEIKLEDCQPALITVRHKLAEARQAISLKLPTIKAGPLCLEIPENINLLSAEQAQLWQALIRQACQSLFGLGYIIVDFVRRDEPNERRGWYLLS